MLSAVTFLFLRNTCTLRAQPVKHGPCRIDGKSVVFRDVMFEQFDLLTRQMDQFATLGALQMIATTVLIMIMTIIVFITGAGRLIENIFFDHALFIQRIQLPVDRGRSDRLTFVFEVIANIIGREMLMRILFQELLHLLTLFRLILRFRRSHTSFLMYSAGNAYLLPNLKIIAKSDYTCYHTECQ